jgi:hypothetical protein
MCRYLPLKKDDDENDYEFGLDEDGIEMAEK